MVDPERAAARIIDENRKEEEELLTRRCRARELAKQWAKTILDRSEETSEVWGFGSSFEQWRHYRKSSDIDIAIDRGDTISLYPIVEQREYKVDLIDLSDTDPGIAAFIRKEGTLIAKRQENGNNAG